MAQEMIEEKHISPDGKLTLVVHRDAGDCIIGFEGSEWHTHADVLVPRFGASESEATSGFIHAVKADELVIAVCPIAEMGEQVWITPRPQDEAEQQKTHLPDLRLRYWSGKQFRSQHAPAT